MAEEKARQPRRLGPRIRLWLIGDLAEVSIWRGIRLIIAVVVVLVLTAAAIERIVEPETFTSYGRALWWGIVTIATVGYGDIVPHTQAGRVVASLTILFAMAVVPTVTTIVVSTLITRAQSRDRAEIRSQISAVMAQLGRIEERLDERTEDRG